MNNDTGIYAITSPSGKQYIGSSVSIKRRWAKHRQDLRAGRHHNSHLQFAWDKHGEAAMVFTVLALCPVTDLLAVEQRRINSLFPAYNIALIAGAPMLGRAMSAESRAKQSLKLLGRLKSLETRAAMRKPKSAEHRANITKGQLGKNRRPHTEEARRKIAASGIGRIVTDETKKKISRSKTGQKRAPFSDEWRQKLGRKGALNHNWGRCGADHPHARPVVCVDAGVEFGAAKVAAQWLRENGHPKAAPTSITATCRGKQSTAYGHRWRYAD